MANGVFAEDKLKVVKKDVLAKVTCSPCPPWSLARSSSTRMPPTPITTCSHAGPGNGTGEGQGVPGPEELGPERGAAERVGGRGTVTAHEASAGGTRRRRRTTRRGRNATINK